jgi:hypothetical protein
MQGKALSSDREWEKILQLAVTVSKGIKPDTHSIQKAEMQVGKGSGLGITNMSIASHARSGTTCYQCGEVGMIMNVGVTNPTTVEQQSAI